MLEQEGRLTQAIAAKHADLIAQIEANTQELKKYADEKIAHETAAREAAVQAIKAAQTHQERCVQRAHARLDALEQVVLHDRQRTVRLVVAKEKAGQDRKAAIAYVNEQLQILGYEPLAVPRTYPQTRRDGTQCWVVVGLMASPELANELIFKHARLLKQDGTKGIYAVTYEQSRRDFDDVDLLKTSTLFTQAAAEYERETGKKPFWLFGKARLGRVWWSVDKVLELGEELLPAGGNTQVMG